MSLNEEMNVPYSALPESGFDSSPTYAFIPRRARRRQCLSSCCCALLVLGVLLTFFLVPRDPQIRYVSSQPYNTTTGIIEQTFEFKNNNFYTMEWSNLQVDVQLCTFVDNWHQATCDADHPLLHYEYPAEFETKSQGEKNLNFNYDVKDSGTATISQLEQMSCILHPGEVIALRTIGSVDASLSNGHSFGGQSIDQLAILVCNN